MLHELALLQVGSGPSLFAATNTLRAGCSLTLTFGVLKKIQGVVGGSVVVHAGDLLAEKVGRLDGLELVEVKTGERGIGRGL